MPSAIRSRRSGFGKHQIVTLDLVRSGAAAQFIERLHVRRIVHRTQLGDEVGAEVLAKFLDEPRLLKSDVVAQKAEQIAGRRRHAAEIADFGINRSEERRVGKECRSRWSPYH